MITSFLKVTSFYKDFLQHYYSQNPEITGKSYDEQYKHLMAQGYGYADYFPHYFEKNHSVRSKEIIHNASHLQKAWALEAGSKSMGDELLLEQICAFQPEVLYIQDSISFSAGFIERIKEKVKSLRLLVGHCCAPYTSANLETFSHFDVVLTCSEKFREEFKKGGVDSYLFPHAVEASLIELNSSKPDPENDIIFIGSLIYRKEFHQKRIAYVEEILKSDLPFSMFGILEEDPWVELRMKQAAYLLVKSLDSMGIKGYLKNRSLRKISQLKAMPESNKYSDLIKGSLNQELLFGKQMLSEIAKHAVGFNLHIEVAGDYAANVRMFEVAGAGSLLISDHKRNMSELYEPDKEVLTYKTKDECIEKLKWAIDNPVEARKIACAGQERTLKDHTVEQRVELLYEIITKELRKS
jgi:spore maturation protein CgeB